MPVAGLVCAISAVAELPALDRVGAGAEAEYSVRAAGGDGLRRWRGLRLRRACWTEARAPGASSLEP